MIAARISLSFILAAAFLTGCDDKKPDAPKVEKPAVDAAKTAADAAKSAADAAKTSTDTAAKTAADAAATAKTQATDWMSKLEDAIKAKKLDEAKTYLDKLDTIKASLPDDLKTRLATLKTSFDAAKALPSLPAIPGASK